MSSSDLVRWITEARPDPDSIMFWRLGQASLVLRMGGKLFLFDPFFTAMAGRLIPSPFKPEDLTGVDYVTGTHDHVDHIDRDSWPLLAKTSPQAKFLVPDILADNLAKELHIPRNRFIGLDDGVTVEEGGFRFTGIAAAHELLEPDKATGRYRFLGIVAEAGGRRIYHAGDCCPYEGLETRLRRAGKFDIMFLPINGRDAARLREGIFGNFSYQEAAELAGMLRPGLAVPIHYDMFEGNLEDPEMFAGYLDVKFPDLPYRLCKVGEGITVSG